MSIFGLYNIRNIKQKTASNILLLLQYFVNIDIAIITENETLGCWIGVKINLFQKKKILSLEFNLSTGVNDIGQFRYKKSMRIGYTMSFKLTIDENKGDDIKTYSIFF